MPSLGTSVPSPAVLSVVLCPLESTLHSICELSARNAPFEHIAADSSPKPVISEICLLSVSDDGKIWNWLLTVEGIRHCIKSDNTNVSGSLYDGSNRNDDLGPGVSLDESKVTRTELSGSRYSSNSALSNVELNLKVCNCSAGYSHFGICECISQLNLCQLVYSCQ